LIDKRWAWTEAEENAFKITDAYKELKSEVADIKKKFSANNKGYSLRTHIEPRRLITQINYWNGNPTVKALGKNLLTKAKRELGKKTYPATPADKDIAAFKAWLQAVTVGATVSRTVKDEKTGKDKQVKKWYGSPTHATPGLSSHGRLRAIDFKVYKKSTLIAGVKSVNVKTVWEKPGWKKKLKKAVEAVSSNWDGPLEHPNEPWHFTYTGK
jgi:hypothetical protein